MGRACLLTFVVAYLSLSVVHGQDFVAPMEISAVRASRADGNVKLDLHVMHYVKEERVRIVEVDGQQRKITSVVQLPIILSVALTVDGKNVRVFDLEGEIVDSDKLPARPRHERRDRHVVHGQGARSLSANPPRRHTRSLYQRRSRPRACPTNAAGQAVM